MLAKIERFRKPQVHRLLHMRSCRPVGGPMLTPEPHWRTSELDHGALEDVCACGMWIRVRMYMCPVSISKMSLRLQPTNKSFEAAHIRKIRSDTLPFSFFLRHHVDHPPTLLLLALSSATLFPWLLPPSPTHSLHLSLPFFHGCCWFTLVCKYAKKSFSNHIQAFYLFTLSPTAMFLRSK